ncbi:MarR family winged helix-turn-helix transcriptional regulator [Clostridium algidicarnis]|uniref:MarR family winged helix-turn-helix transcriptional regulator n=1 Tax=Clostridium algidicarnis TaxID=37659 RepID=UPI00162ABCAB|nr:MarR family transcriptional regulator [Clostridium algidicarnis]MBB6696553.1 MarR family transcriptional regulator [Clostridium algidicarnis]MBU3202818.1 MarR family transcriptional regulator [Clostridium algidicarnis]MBU3205875.1 MarR family transcriptional regulator [Clostridium algidicarnis]MBU3210972.1 MarR family transcriptional regulator [Clostridium algidicarnis]MBU3222520.1 MarR family transcriptional regulator [Clostridium algidicarnis]
MDSKNKLYETYSGLMKIKGECSCRLIDELNMSELTLRQIEYIKKIGKYDELTISKLAEVLNLSKPSITEMVKRFVKLDCVYKRQCKNDGRVQYIFLTERGKSIASFEDLEVKRLVDKIAASLNEDEINDLINILLKVK